MRDQDGFTLIGLMVVIAVINIGLGVAATSWVTINKRANEAELIWRGEQYARAIGCHQAQEGGYPDELEDLLDSDCIRALYPDPMSPTGEWRVLRESDLRDEFSGGGGFDSAEPGASPPGASGSSPSSSGMRGLSGLGLSSGGLGGGGGGGGSGGGNPGQRSSAGAGQSDSLQDAYQRLRSLSERLSQNLGSGSGNGIVGVVSRSTGEGLREYRGELTYDAWQFTAR